MNAPTINCGNISKEDAQKLVDVLNSIQRSNVDLNSLVGRIDELIAQVKNKVDPNRAVVTYDFYGTRRSSSPGLENFDQSLTMKMFRPMDELFTQQKWIELARLAEENKLKVPEWPTPMAYAGIAYAKLCVKDKALTNLYQFRDRVKDYPAYVEPLKEIVVFIALAERLPVACPIGR